MKKNNFYLLDLQLFSNGAPVDPGVIDDPDPIVVEEKMVSKKRFDKLAEELSRLKKEKKDKLTQEELFNQEKQELLEELEEMKKEKKQSKIIAGLSKSGLDEKTIISISESVINDDTEKFIKLINQGIANVVKEKDDEIAILKLDSTTKPSGQGPLDKKITREDVAKMTVDQKQKLFEENKELFMELYK